MEIKISRPGEGRVDWRVFLEDAYEAFPKETQVEVSVRGDDGQSVSIHLGELPEKERMLELEMNLKSGNWDFAKRAGEYSSLDPDADFSFARAPEPGEAEAEYGVEDLENLYSKYPGFWGARLDPLLYSDFDMYERRGFLWMASRATVDGKPAMLMRVAPGINFFADTSESGCSYALLDRETGRYTDWKPTSSIAVPYGEMCAKFIDDLKLPEESSLGIDWLAAGRKLKSMGCLMHYESDFFWHDRNQLMLNGGKAMVSGARECGSSYFPNAPDSDGTPGPDAAKRIILDGTSLDAIIILKEGGYRIRDLRDMPRRDRAEALAQSVARMPPAEESPAARPLCEAGGRMVAADYDPEVKKYRCRECDMDAPAWAKVKHPEIPCRPREEPGLSPGM